jgi:hypothetical protein
LVCRCFLFYGRVLEVLEFVRFEMFLLFEGFGGGENTFVWFFSYEISGKNHTNVSTVQ